MSLELIGLVMHEHRSETIEPGQAPAVDPEFMVRCAVAHEEAGFDRLLVAHNAASPDAVLMAANVAAQTARIKFMIAHRPGFVAPTYAARMFATFDLLTKGRGGIHVISGGSDADQRRDGDFLDHDERYRRTGEWVDVFRRTLTSDAPFSHAGEFFRVENAQSKVRPYTRPRPPIFFGGVSDAAISCGAKFADYWALFGEPLADTRELIQRIRRAAEQAGRDPAAIRFVLGLRNVLGETEAAAWKRADAILERIRQLSGAKFGTIQGKPQAESGRRLRAAAAGGRVRDERLWTEVAHATGGGSNSTGLVGTPKQVAAAMQAYQDIGISGFLMRGFEPQTDAREYGRDLIPLLRAQSPALAAAE